MSINVKVGKIIIMRVKIGESISYQPYSPLFYDVKDESLQTPFGRKPCLLTSCPDLHSRKLQNRINGR